MQAAGQQEIILRTDVVAAGEHRRMQYVGLEAVVELQAARRFAGRW